MESAKNGEEAFTELSLAEKDKFFKFAKRLLYHICVKPCIVDEPKGEDEISLEDLEADDLRFLMEWAKGGHRGESALGDFRQQPTIVAGSNGKELRKATKRVAWD